MEPQQTEPAPAKPRMRRSRRALLWVGGALAVLLLATAFARTWLLRKAEDMFRARILRAMTRDFKAPVTLGSLDVSFSHGVVVRGQGLQVESAADNAKPKTALLEVARFDFRMTIAGLLSKPQHLEIMHLDGMRLILPPSGHRQQMRDLGKPNGGSGIRVDRIVCENAVLVIERNPRESYASDAKPSDAKPGDANPTSANPNSANPGGALATTATRQPLVFNIHRLVLLHVASGRPFHYDVALRNPIPAGEIHAIGDMGPLRAGRVREAMLDGDYTFTNADLSTVSGIGGMLASTGKFSGKLASIAVNGATDTPDFYFKTSGNKLPLKTLFRATVDGTNGNVYLDKVHGQLMNTPMTVVGSVTRVMEVPEDPHSRVRGHDVELDLDIRDGRAEDLLRAGVRSGAMMTGRVRLATHVSVMPGQEKVMERMRLRGSAHIDGAQFTSARMQNSVDKLSMRSEGNAKQVKEGDAQVVPSAMDGEFTMVHRVVDFSRLDYSLPGADVEVQGRYSLIEKTYDFHGVARMKAKASQMTTGWKSFALKAVDPFLEKGGAGTQVPIKITGVGSQLKWELDFHDKDKSNAGPTLRPFTTTGTPR